MQSESLPKSILIIRPSALGDVCRSVPVLASLRSAYPEARIDWLVQDSFADAISGHPALSGVVPFERGRLGKDLKSIRPASTIRFLRRLRAQRYDLVIDAQGLFRSGMLALATGARRRVGYANAQELGWLGYNTRHRISREMHAVDRMLALVERAGVKPIADMRLSTLPAWREWAAQTLGASRAAVLAPTSRWAGKRWPAERFAALAERMLAMGIERVAIVGARSEREQCGPLLELASRDERVLDLIGKTSVGELMAVVERAAVVVANDSAAIHMAVGFERPMVALYGPTSIARVGPYRREGDVIQHVQPGEVLDHKDDLAGREMMERISVDEVVERVRIVLKTV
ncbi:MAG: lipopolysaccharide heptosyltransferase I [Phycisphaeraceae bacterium]|nr:MAG: lipopolysaccharide heptosyltransferase I [Phycisphaeraceae bacterium]